MERIIKFRIWDSEKKRMSKDVPVFTPIIQWDDGDIDMPTDFAVAGAQRFLFLQYCGLKDKNGKEIYEGDIFRVEEDGAEDGTDQIYYLIVVWVKEWAMFCTLRVADEYFNYLHGDVKALDEPMFWTYTLEDTNDRRFYLCGNIYETPELLKL